MNRIDKLQTSIQRLSFTIVLCMILQYGLSQITSGHVDDFQNLSPSGWMEGGVSPNPPIVIASGGPAGDGDAYLRNVSSGSGAGGKWVMYNQSVNWTGNYLTAGIGEISMQVRNSGNQDVHLRLTFNGSGGPISSSAVFTIGPGTEWQSIEFVIDPLLFVPLMGGGNSTATLSSVNEFRILSNPMPSNVGVDIVATVDIDNIRISGISAVGDQSPLVWSLFPNPAKEILQLSRPGYEKPISITLTNISGQILLQRIIQSPYSLDISTMTSGMYILQTDGKYAGSVRIGL